MMNARRTVLQGMALGAMALGLAPCLMAQGELHSTDLGQGFTLISGAGTNVLVAEGVDGVIIVDGGSQAQAEPLLAEIRRLCGDKPVTALFNTNWRPERAGLNYLLGPQGIPIIAHENARLWQNADVYVGWQDIEYQPMPKEAQANQTFYQTGSLRFDNETVEYGFISQANTDSDIYVHFTQADILFVGAMLNPDSYLLLDYVTGGWISGAQETTRGLLERAGDDTRIIAATSGVLDKAALEEQLGMLDHAYDVVAKAFQTGRSLEDFLASDPMADYRARYGDPTLFLRLLYRGTWYHIPGRAVRNII